MFIGGKDDNAAPLAGALGLSLEDWESTYGAKQYGPDDTEFIQSDAITIGAYSESDEPVSFWELRPYFIKVPLSSNHKVTAYGTEIHTMQDMEAAYGEPGGAYAGEPSRMTPVYVWKCLGFYILAEFDGTDSGTIYAVTANANLDNLMATGGLDKNVFPENWYGTLNSLGLYGELSEIN